MADPWFFVSYSTKNEQEYVTQFYEALRKSVFGLVGGPLEEDIGFLAGKDIQIGENWPAVLDHALETCRVFVPLLSAAYLESDYCGREWLAFQERLAAAAKASGAGQKLPLIFPVIWLPLDYITLPPEVADVQRLTVDAASEYGTEGMRYLMRQAGRVDMRNATIDKFAKLLVGLARNNRLDPSPVPVRIKQLKSPWQAAETTAQGAPRPTPVPPQAAVGPSYAQFVYVAGRADEIAMAPLTRAQEFYGAGPGDWKPYLPNLLDDVVFLTQKIALDQKLKCGEALPLDANLLRRVEAAELQNSIVILVVDTWSLQIASYSALMDGFDRTRLRNCITLVPWNPQDPDTVKQKAALEQVLGQVFRRTMAQRPPYFYDTIGSLDEYQAQLSQALARLKLELVGLAPVLQTAGASSTQTQPLLPTGAAQ